MNNVIRIIPIFLLLSGYGHAAITLEFSPESGGTRLHIGGSLDTTGISFSPIGPFADQFQTLNSGEQLWFTVGSGTYRFAEHGQPVPDWHSYNSTTIPLIDVSGDDFGINDMNIALPDGYQSGSPIEASFLLDGVPLAAINPQPGVILTLGNGDTVSVSVVPEPGFSFLLGFGAISACLLRKRKAEQGASDRPLPAA